ncbi:MAG: hypothetical protein HZB53_22210 [Chloroflexi bacterium]|nr:hypothetical protein [Chloroflexota bacterium]
MQNPQHVTEGLHAAQAESESRNGPLRERLAIIESQLSDSEAQLAKLLDLYLNGEFAKELLTERKLRLEKAVADLKREHADAAAQMQTVAITDEQVESLKAFCEEVRVGLDNATFEDKRRYFDLMDVRGKLAIENNEKVVYVSCKIGKQRVSLLATSPSSSTGAIATTPCGCR